MLDNNNLAEVDSCSWDMARFQHTKCQISMIEPGSGGQWKWRLCPWRGHLEFYRESSHWGFEAPAVNKWGPKIERLWNRWSQLKMLTGRWHKCYVPAVACHWGSNPCWLKWGPSPGRDLTTQSSDAMHGQVARRLHVPLFDSVVGQAS